MLNAFVHCLADQPTAGALLDRQPGRDPVSACCLARATSSQKPNAVAASSSRMSFPAVTAFVLFTALPIARRGPTEGPASSTKQLSVSQRVASLRYRRQPSVARLGIRIEGGDEALSEHMRAVLSIALSAASIICLVAAGIIAQRKNRSENLFALLGLILGPLGVLAALLVSTKAPEGMQAVTCPRCNARQNIPAGDTTFECAQCKSIAHTQENRRGRRSAS